MAEATPRTFFAGASLVWGRQRVLWLIYVVNFVLAYFATRGTNERIAAILDHSLAAGQLVHGFNLGALGSLATNPESPFGGSISASLSAAILFTVFMIFATGGVLCHLLFRPAASCRRVLRSSAATISGASSA